MNVPFGTTLILLEGSAKGHFYVFFSDVLRFSGAPEKRYGFSFITKAKRPLCAIIQKKHARNIVFKLFLINFAHT